MSGLYNKDRIGALAVGLYYGTGSKCWQQYSPLSLIQIVACSVSLISSTGRAGQGLGSPSQRVLRALQYIRSEHASCGIWSRPAGFSPGSFWGASARVGWRGR